MFNNIPCIAISTKLQLISSLRLLCPSVESLCIFPSQSLETSNELMEQNLIPSLMSLHDSVTSDGHTEITVLLTILKATEVPDIGIQLLKSTGDMHVIKTGCLDDHTIVNTCACVEEDATGRFSIPCLKLFLSKDKNTQH